MDVKYLEDFSVLAETRSFSRAAALRHVTQPAFSRRIKAIENWLGADLIDRGRFPLALTPAGEAFLAHASEMVQALKQARQHVRAQAVSGADVVTFAMPHTLAFTFFPAWLTEVQSRFGIQMHSRLSAQNVHDAVVQLTEANCDLLLAYHHPSSPIELDLAHYDMLLLGVETVSAFSAPNDDGQARYSLAEALAQRHAVPEADAVAAGGARAVVAPHAEAAGEGDARLPFLAYSPAAYLSHIAELLIEQADAQGVLRTTFDTDMAEVLKAMTLAGHGLSFLPKSSVKRELQTRRLVNAGGPQMDLEIRLYRQREHPTRTPKSAAARLWANLAAQT